MPTRILLPLLTALALLLPFTGEAQEAAAVSAETKLTDHTAVMASHHANQEEPVDGGNATGTVQTGCCQHTQSACAGDVTKSQCDQMDGTFYADHMCMTDTGKCARQE